MNKLAGGIGGYPGYCLLSLAFRIKGRPLCALAQSGAVFHASPNHVSRRYWMENTPLVLKAEQIEPARRHQD